MKKPQVSSLFFAGVLAASMLMVATRAQAVIAGPYTADASTLHLWHLNETATPAVDSASGGTNCVGLLNGATLGSASFTGFGNALNTLDGGQDLIAGANKDAVLTPSTAAQPGNIAFPYCDATSGAFTFEAIVWIGFDPTKNLGTTAFGGNNRAAACQILACESTANANRIFQFRLAPLGFTLVGTIFATNSPFLTFENLRTINANQATIYAPIPMTGPDAIVSNNWYHVAVTYNGVPNTANNIKFYWTLMDSSRTAANQLTISSAVTTLSGPLPLGTATAAPTIGNLARNITTAGNNFLGLIDEVRVSKVERSSVQMMFTPPNVTIISPTSPTSQMAAAGDSVTLTTVAGGGGTLFYQWRHAGTNLPGATASSLGLPNITTSQAGDYVTVVTNVSSSATSAVFTVRVGGVVAEIFSTGLSDSRAPLLGGSIDPHWQLIQSGDPAYPGPSAFVDSAVPASYLANTTNSQWIAPGDSINNIGGVLYTFRTSFIFDTLDPTNAQITGNWMTDNQGVDMLLNGVSLGLTNGGSLVSFTPFTITNGFVAGSNTLDLVISNAPGAGPNPTALRAELRGVALALPSTALQLVGLPSNVSTQSQQTAVFAVAAVGSGPITYQWYHGLTLLPSQTNRTLILSGITSGDGGTYSVNITNSLGFTNASATLTVVTPPAVAWTGAASSDWDVSSINWQDTGTLANVAFSQYDDVLFDSRGSSAPTVNLTQALNPNSITVNAANDYTFTSFANNGSIAGSLSLTKQGSGTLIMDTANSYTGPTLISGGALQLGNGDAKGSVGNAPITNNAALVFNRTDAFSLFNAITGAGSLTNIGSGGPVLTASNSYSGPTTIASGVVHLRNSAGLGTAAAGTTVGSGGQLFIDVNLDLPGEALTLSGNGPVTSNDGALHKGGSGATAIGGTVTVAADAMIKVDGASTLTFTNAAGISGANASLDLFADNTGTGNLPVPVTLGTGGIFKDGLGSWVLSGTNTFSGQITNNAGNLTLAGNQAKGNATNIVLNASANASNTTRITISGAVTYSSPLSLFFLGTTASPDFRCSLDASDSTNFLNCPMFMGGDGVIQFSANGASELDVNGPINSPAFGGKFILRGASKGFVNSQINIGGHVSKTDGSTWTINSTGNSWTNTDVAGGTLKMGANGVFPGTTSLNMTTVNAILDLAGFSQQVGTLAGPGGPIGNSSTTSDSTLSVNPPGLSLFNGVIQNSVAGGTRKVGLSVVGGDLTVGGTNTYTGDTAIASGAILELFINGSISNSANLIVNDGGKLDASLRTDGTLVVNPSQTLKANGAGNVAGSVVNNGSIELAVSKAGATLTNDSLNGMSAITYGGTLKLHATASPAINTSDTFKLFSAGSYSGAFAAIVPVGPSAGLLWDTSTLTSDGTLRVTAGTVPPQTNITFQVSGNQITLSWPASNLGSRLQAQTNSINVGLSTNWVDVPGSTTNTQMILPINRSNGAVFFRLIYP
jgi:autotransporter-associated beta strand protein